MAYSHTKRRYFFLILVFILSVSYSSTRFIVSEKTNFTDFPLDKIEDGDIILRRGYGWVSDFIANQLQEKYPVTHCGFLKWKDSQLEVYHMIWDDTHDGLKIEPLDTFLKHSHPNSIILVRPKQLQPHHKINIFKHLKKITIQHIVFDKSFDHKDSTQLYCIEMMQFVLQKTTNSNYFKETITLKSKSVLPMRNFWNPSHFEVYYNQWDSILHKKRG